jgi:hypothetical protein
MKNLRRSKRSWDKPTSLDLAASELAEYRRQLEENRVRAAELCARLSTDEINWRPGPGQWSVAECVGHLGVSAREYSARILPAVRAARGRALFGSNRSRFGWLTRRVLREMEPPVSSRQRSPKKFHPPAEILEPEEVQAIVETTARSWEQCLMEAEGLDLVRVKVRSPAVPLLRFRLGALFAIVASHERRHLWQAEEVCRSPGFPDQASRPPVPSPS